LNDSFDSVECCFDIVAVFGGNVAGFGNNVERNFVLSTMSKQIELKSSWVYTVERSKPSRQMLSYAFGQKSKEPSIVQYNIFKKYVYLSKTTS